MQKQLAKHSKETSLQKFIHLTPGLGVWHPAETAVTSTCPDAVCCEVPDVHNQLSDDAAHCLTSVGQLGYACKASMIWLLSKSSSIKRYSRWERTDGLSMGFTNSSCSKCSNAWKQTKKRWEWRQHRSEPRWFEWHTRCCFNRSLWCATADRQTLNTSSVLPYAHFGRQQATRDEKNNSIF